MLKKWKLWVNPTPVQVATAQLHDAEANLLVMKVNAEYAAAMVKMFEGRIERLRRDIKRMMEEGDDW
jgi:hypothetical protein